MKWQPIETAPKGRYVLLYGLPWEQGDCPFGAGKLKTFIEEWWERVSDTQKELQSRAVDEWEGEFSFTPTHWAELPMPPDAHNARISGTSGERATSDDAEPAVKTTDEQP